MSTFITKLLYFTVGTAILYFTAGAGIMDRHQKKKQKRVTFSHVHTVRLISFDREERLNYDFKNQLHFKRRIKQFDVMFARVVKFVK